jgi:hypothetical protein
VADETPETAQEPSEAPSVPQFDPQAIQDAQELVDAYKKSELKAAAEVHGVDVPSGATKTDIAEAIVQSGPARPPVTVDNRTSRGDDDALEGSFVKVVDGEHTGQVGVFTQVLRYGQDGYPELVLVRFRDATYTHDVDAILYKDLRPATPYVGGR